MPLRTVNVELWHLLDGNNVNDKKADVTFTKHDTIETIHAGIISITPAASYELYQVSCPDKDVYEYTKLSDAAVVSSLKAFCNSGDVSELPGLPDNNKLPLAFRVTQDTTVEQARVALEPAGPQKRNKGRRPAIPWRNRMYSLATDNMPRAGNGTYLLKTDRKGLMPRECQFWTFHSVCIFCAGSVAQLITSKSHAAGINIQSCWHAAQC